MSLLFKEETLGANRRLLTSGLVTFTWGNVSIIDRKNQFVYIKPSGATLSEISAQHISKIGRNGNQLAGKKPSVDTPTHLEIYKAFENIGAVVHTHSKYATIFAQASRDITCLGTTHADYFDGDVPCISCPTFEEVNNGYETNTGKIIVKYFKNLDLDPLRMPAVLIEGHGVFCWGKNSEKALENAFVLEQIAEMAYRTLIMNKSSQLPEYILRKHFDRKHGEDKYYGQ